MKAEINADHCFAFGRNTTLALSSVCYNLLNELRKYPTFWDNTGGFPMK